MIPYPHWLNTGDNAWQLVAATLVGLMSLPGIAVLYGGLVQKKWSVNTMLMAFSGFCLVLIVWVLWGYNMGFGQPWTTGTGLIHNFIGHPRTVLSALGEQSRAQIPLVTPPQSSGSPPLNFPAATLIYFQFVFAAITPLLFLGSVLGRMSFKAWLIFVPLWSSIVYSVNAFMVWGGGYWGAKGALDYSGGYVIHLAAGVSGFVAAWVIGPRLARDRAHAVPNNLPLVAIGSGILWLGWNGFNGGDPYFAGADAAAAVLNTNLATAAAMMTWILWDMFGSRQKKPTLLGGVNGMIVGLVAITPAAGFVNGSGALALGAIASSLVWVAWNYLPRVRPFSKVDDAMGVIYTHGIAGLLGGLLVGVFADPTVIEYIGVGKTSSFSGTGLLYGHTLHQLKIQAGAALTIIIWDAVMTFVLLKVIGLFIPLRMTDEQLETGDLAVHDEEAYPSPTGAERLLPGESAGVPAGAMSGVSTQAAPRPLAGTGIDGGV